MGQRLRDRESALGRRQLPAENRQGNFVRGLTPAVQDAFRLVEPHSVMFEVAYCVMLYTSVLSLEFSPIVLERFNLQKPLQIVRAALIRADGARLLLRNMMS